MFPTLDLPLAIPRAAVGHATRWRRLGIMLLTLLLAAASLNMSAADKQTRNALIGAGLGAAGGALLSHGDAWGTLGGAAAGGLIGAVVTKDKHHGRRGDDRGYDRGRGGNDRHDQHDDRDRRYGH